MSETRIRWPARAAVLAAVFMPLLALACSRSAPPQAPSGPPPFADQGFGPPLAGGPSAQSQALAEVALEAGDTGTMRARAEPQLYAEGYGRGYGDFYDHRASRRDIERARWLAHERLLAHERWLRRRQVRHWYYSHHRLVFEHPVYGRPQHRPLAAHAAQAAAPPRLAGAPPAATPAPTPHPASLVHPRRARIAVTPAAQPVRLQPAPAAPLDHLSLALPVISSQPPPAATPDEAAAAPAVDVATQLGQLTSAVAEDMKSARLDVPPAISTGGEDKVVLTLPADLLKTMQARAAQTGLGPAARKVFVTAKLGGQGYAITPNEDQTARLQAGEPTVFTWDVKPSATPGGVLTADMTGSLQGQGQGQTFALGAVTAQIPVGGQAATAPAPIQAPVQAPVQLKLPDFSHIRFGGVGLPDLSRLHLRDLAIPGHPVVTVPGLGRTPSYKIVAVGLFALIVILLLSIVRSASARRERAERRRRFHAFESSEMFSDEHP